MSSYQKVQNFKCRCPLLRQGVFGIHESHQIPNTPCDRSLNDVFLNQHLQWYHNFDSVSARKLVRALCNHFNPNEPLFSIHEVIVKQNISVESYKCKCPLTHGGAFGLSDEHDITNIPCGRAGKEVLCFQHLQYHHNLSSRAAKKIVLAVLSYTPTVTQLFDNDDLVTQPKCAVRKLKSKCPLLGRHLYGLGDHHQVPNVPCDRADQHIFLFHHLTYFHKLNAQAATKLIRALLVNKDPSEPLFHYNDTIVVSNTTSNSQQIHQKVRRTKKPSNQSQSQQQTAPQRLEQFQYSNQFDASSLENHSPNFVTDVRNKYQSLLNPTNASALSAIIHRNSESNNDGTPLDCSRFKSEPYQMSYSYSTSNADPTPGLGLNTFLN